MRRAIFAFGLVNLACGSDPTFTEVQSQVLNSCTQASCHSVEAHKGDLVLVDGQSYAALVGVSADQSAAQAAGKIRVVAGSPSTSFLVEKLTAGLDPSLGMIMPQGTDGLDAERLALVEDWIAAGAKND